MNPAAVASARGRLCLRCFWALCLIGSACRAQPAAKDSAAQDSTGKASPAADSSGADTSTTSTSATASIPSAAAIPWPQNWHTEPSPLLLRDLQDKVKHSRVRGRVGLAVYSLRFQRFEAEWNDTDWFTPASCLKLLVTAAVLDTFPVNYAPATTLEVSGTVSGKTLRGLLRVIGGGDPNISDRFFPDALQPLRTWVDSLRQAGIDTVRGRVEVSDSFFTGPHRPAAWLPHHFDTWYGAEVSALSFNDNCYVLSVTPAEKIGQPAAVQVVPDVGYVRVIDKARTRGGGRSRLGLYQREDSTVVTVSGHVGLRSPGRSWVLPVRDPPRYFRAAFLQALNAGGVAFLPDTTADSSMPLLKTYRLTTAPLIALVEEANQRSQNLHAELLLRHLGKRVYGVGSAEAGLRAERAFLTRLGIDTADFDLHDGCGLSHDDRVKPRAMALLLSRMARRPFGRDYVASLAQPGVDGVTGRRLRLFSDEDLVRYKTGTITRVSGLCGYIFGIDGDTLAAAAMLNDYRGSPEAAANLMDSLFAHITRWYNKERPAEAVAYKLLQRSDAPTDYTARLRYFSRALEGTPYFLGPTGEGRFGAIDPKPILDFDRFDCVTYLESDIALARAHQAADLIPAILPIRYHGDTVSFATRNHFFVGDWLDRNPQWFRVLTLPGDTVVHKTLFKNKLFAAHGLPPLPADPQIDLRYLPYDRALQLAAHWTLGDQFLGVAFVTNLPGLDVTHTGFIDAPAGGPPLLRHASELKGRVVTQDFKEYLESRRGKCAGVVLFAFLPPPGG